MSILKHKKKWYKQSCSEDNLCANALNFLHHLNVPFIKEKTKDFLYSHGSYPNLISVVDLLKTFNVESLIVKISSEELKQVITPLIAYFPKDKTFVLVTDVIENQVYCVSSRFGYYNVNIEDFQKDWLGIVLAAEANPSDKRFFSFLKHSNKILLLLGSFFIIFSNWISIRNSLDINYLAYYKIFFLNIAGVLLSIRLVMNSNRERQSRNSKFYRTFFFKKYHSNLGCDRCSYTLNIFKNKFAFDDSISILFLVNLIAINLYPQIVNSTLLIYGQLISLIIFLLLFVYSFYNFIRITKQLCVPRLTLFFLLTGLVPIWLNLLPQGNNSDDFIYLFQYIISFTFVGFLYFKIKKYYLQLVYLRQQNSEYNYLKRSKKVMVEALNSKVVQVPKPSRFDLCFGNLQANKIIILVIDPFNILSLKYLNKARSFANLSDGHQFKILLQTNTPQAKLFAETIIQTKLKKGNKMALKSLMKWYNIKVPILMTWIRDNDVKSNDPELAISINNQIEIWNEFMEKELPSIPSVLFEGRLMPQSLSFDSFQFYFSEE